jgi:hypothetical protein
MAIGERKKLPVMRTDDVFRGYLEADRVRQLKYLVADVVPVLPYNIVLNTKIVPATVEALSDKLGTGVVASNDLLLSTLTYGTSGTGNLAYLINMENNIVVSIIANDTSVSWGNNVPSGLDEFNSNILVAHQSNDNVEIHSYDITTGNSTYLGLVTAPNGGSVFAVYGVKTDSFGNVFMSDISSVDGVYGHIWKFNWNGTSYTSTLLARDAVYDGLSYGAKFVVNNNPTVESERLYTGRYSSDNKLSCINTITNTVIETFTVPTTVSIASEIISILEYYDNYVLFGDDGGVHLIFFDETTQTHSVITTITPPVGASVRWGTAGSIYKDLFVISDWAVEEVYCYKIDFDTQTVELIQTLVNPGNPDADRFGMSVDINDNYIYIGAPDDDDVDTDGGAIYVYNKY